MEIYLSDTGTKIKKRVCAHASMTNADGWNVWLPEWYYYAYELQPLVRAKDRK